MVSPKRVPFSSPKVVSKNERSAIDIKIYRIYICAYDPLELSLASLLALVVCAVYNILTGTWEAAG